MDLITLGVEVQTTGAAQAAQGLGNVQKAAIGAAGASDTLEDQLRGLVSQLSKVAREELQTEAATKKLAAEQRKAAADAAKLAAEQAKVGNAARPVVGAMDSVGQAFRNNSSSIQNASFQLQDIIVQMEMGVPASRVLGQQLPQLLGGFGPLGAVIGLAAGALLAFAPALFDSAEGAKTLEDALGGLTDATSELNDIAATDLKAVTDAYGELNSAILLLIERRQQLALDTSAADANSRVTATLQDLNLEYGNLLALQQQIEDAKAGKQGDFSAAFSSSAEELAFLNEQFTQFSEDMGFSEDKARSLASALYEFQTATGISEQADAAAGLIAALEAAGTSTGPLFDGLVAAEDALRKSERAANEAAAAVFMLTTNEPGGTWLSSAISQVEVLTTKLYEAAKARASALNITASVGIGAGGRPDAPNNGGAILAARVAIERKRQQDAETGGSRGGSSTSTAEQDAKRLYESTRTEAEKYAAELAKVGDLYKAGAVDSDVYSRAVAKLAEEFDPLGRVIANLSSSVENELNAAFAAVQDGTKTLGEALLDFASNVLAKVAQDLFAQQFASPIATGLSGILGGVAGSVGAAPGTGSLGLPMPFANGGVVSGPTIFPFANGTGLMGEAGPEAIMPLKRGPDGALGVSASTDARAPVTINDYSTHEVAGSALIDAIKELLRAQTTEAKVVPFTPELDVQRQVVPFTPEPIRASADPLPAQQPSATQATRQGTAQPNITINNYSGQEATASSDSAGNIVVEIGRAIAQDITSGGPTYRAIRTTFGLGNRLQQRG